jgi:serpin B
VDVVDDRELVLTHAGYLAVENSERTQRHGFSALSLDRRQPILDVAAITAQQGAPKTDRRTIHRADREIKETTMRCSILLTSLIGSLLLGAGCGSDQGNNTPDMRPADKQDAAAVNPPDAAAKQDGTVVNPPDAGVDALQDVAPTDAMDVPVQDVAAADTQNAAEANPQDIAGVDAQAGTEAGTGEPGASPGAMASSSMARVTATLTDTEKTDLATSLSGFAFALWQGLRGDPSTKNNFAFSPTSISLALGMVYAGAQGTTASQMQSAMHVTSSSDVYFRSLNWLDAQLESRPDDALKQAQTMYKSSGSSGAAPDPANFRLHVVNGCWGDRSFTFEQPYLDTLAADFGSGVHLADFRTQPDSERLAINAWVSQETLNRINDLIPQGAIDTTTRTVLVNAIHLKLPWYDPFLDTRTNPSTFTKTDGSTVSVPFMSKGGYMPYAEDDTTQAVASPRRPRRLPSSKTRWCRAMRQRSWRAWPRPSRRSPSLCQNSHSRRRPCAWAACSLHWE